MVEGRVNAREHTPNTLYVLVVFCLYASGHTPYAREHTRRTASEASKPRPICSRSAPDPGIDRHSIADEFRSTGCNPGPFRPRFLPLPVEAGTAPGSSAEGFPVATAAVLHRPRIIPGAPCSPDAWSDRAAGRSLSSLCRSRADRINSSSSSPRPFFSISLCKAVAIMCVYRNICSICGASRPPESVGAGFSPSADRTVARVSSVTLIPRMTAKISIRSQSRSWNRIVRGAGLPHFPSCRPVAGPHAGSSFTSRDHRSARGAVPPGPGPVPPARHFPTVPGPPRRHGCVLGHPGGRIRLRSLRIRTRTSPGNRVPHGLCRCLRG